MARRRRLSEASIITLPDRQAFARDRALEALNLMREDGLSLTAAANRVGTSRRTMLKYAGRALEKNDRGIWMPKPWDRIIRRMQFPTPSGLEVLPIQDSRSAKKVGRYWTAVRRYLLEGKADRLAEFRSESIQVNGELHQFVTETRILDRLALAGEVRFEDIYEVTD